MLWPLAGWLYEYKLPYLNSRVTKRTRTPKTWEGDYLGRKDSLGVGENDRAMGIHHRCVKMLVSSKCSVSGHAHG